MEKKIRFETIAELQETYPIGSSLVSFKKKIEENRYFYDEKDLKILNQQYDTVAIVAKNVCYCWKMVERAKIVEGFLYDGEYWRPAYNTWDGWLPYDEDDLDERKV
jgi:hypothetical protein